MPADAASSTGTSSAGATPETTTTFDLAVAWLLSPDIEGACGDHPDDDGRETCYGLSRRANPDVSWPPTREQAVGVYRQRYWAPSGLDDVIPRVAWATFDALVNHGPDLGARMVQETLNALGVHPQVSVDGVIGPRTRRALLAVSSQSFLVEFLARRALLYAAHPDFPTFGRGWLRRLFLLHRAVLLMR